MTVLAQISDLHLRVDGDDLGAARALEAAVAALLELRPAPDAVLVSGDLGEHGEAREYTRARELLAPLPMPVHMLAGNHDDAEALAEAFGTPLRYTAASASWRSWPATRRCPAGWRAVSSSTGSRRSSRRRAAARSWSPCTTRRC